MNATCRAEFRADLPESGAPDGRTRRFASPERLAAWAFQLYEQFRPVIPGGKAGWGAAGDLELDKIRGLKEKAG